MMKFISTIFFASLISCFATNAPAYTDHETAVIKVMNKAAGKTYDVSLPLNRDVQYEKLTIVAHTCKQTDPFQVENFFSFIEITKGSSKIFSGWMNKNEPGDNPVQDADYDVWLVRCE